MLTLPVTKQPTIMCPRRSQPRLWPLSCSNHASFHLRLKMSSSELRRTLAPFADNVNQLLRPTSRRGCPDVFRELWRHPRRRVPRAGSPPYQSRSMDSPSTREHSDALCLRYGWRPSRLPSHCICGSQFTVEHALSCSRGGFPSIHHNEIHDITADLLSEVCHSVGMEPGLQHVTEEQLTCRSANRGDDARLDIVATSFWGRDRQRRFFDVRVFNPFTPSYRNSSLPQCYRRNEMKKRRAYDERVREIEHASFSPLVFSTSANVVYKRIASMIASKHDKSYSRTMHWIRCKRYVLLSCVFSSRITICSTSASWTPNRHGHHGPCLLRRPGPMSGLINYHYVKYQSRHLHSTLCLFTLDSFFSSFFFI